MTDFKVGDTVKRKAWASPGSYQVGHHPFVITKTRRELRYNYATDPNGQDHDFGNLELVEALAEPAPEVTYSVIFSSSVQVSASELDALVTTLRAINPKASVNIYPLVDKD